MVTPLNLYATRVFSEQPLGLWALDDKADYISFLSEGDQDLDSWTNTGVDSIGDATDPNFFTEIAPGTPFPEIPVNGIIGDAQNQGLVTFTSPFQLQPSDISFDQETFSFGLYVYTFSKIVNLRLGFKYTDPDSQEIFEVIKSAALSPTLAWAMVAETFRLPENFEDLELILEASYRDDGSPFEFVINAITAGQWAEEFQLKSFGASLIDVPSSINIPATKGLRAEPYGFPTNNGYYIADDGELSAKNAGIPLVFGSRNSTYLKPKTNSPSLIIPGLGFLNASGQFNKLTAEFWIKVRSNAIEPRRIFGPISSDDGIYVEGPFLKLKIGKQVGSHYIQEWDRPMLVDIRLDDRNANVIINGDQVIEIVLDPKEYRFPPRINNGLEQDWLGFYAYDDVPSIQLDCVAIYPYEVPALVAKRRWVYGQAVKVPTDIKGFDSSSSVFVDYPFAKYARNYYFPSSSKWSNGSIENLKLDRDALVTPDHSLPEVRFTDRGESQWFDDLKSSQDGESPVITLNPTSDWDEIGGHLFFSNLNFLETQTKSFYGVFESKDFSPNPQTLFQITNTINSNTLQIYTKGNVITSEQETIFSRQDGNTVTISNITHGLRTNAYVSVYDSERVTNGLYQIKVLTENSFSYVVDSSQQVANAEDPNIKLIYDATIYYSFTTKRPDGSMLEDIFYTTPGQRLNQRFFVGLDIPRFTRARGRQIANFLGTRQRLLAYVAGTESFSQTFRGNIHRVGFCTDRNLKKIQHLFNDQGVPVDYDNVFDLFGPSSYDAGADYFGNDESFWSLVLDGGDPYDFAAITAEEHIASYTLVPKIYFEKFMLDIAVDSYWEDYVPLSYFSKRVPDGKGNLKSEVTFLQFNLDYPVPEIFNNEKIDTSSNVVKSYVAFQYLKEGANAVSSSFMKKEALNKDKVVRPDSNWMSTKYEVVDGSIIYPPSNVDINAISISVYLELVVDGISINPIRIRSLQLSSQAYGNSPNRIGTKFGKELVPFNRSGIYYDYRLAPPISIYKASSPYLYKTSNSGIEVKVPYSNKNTGGISVPINQAGASFFKIGSLQMSLKFGEELFPDVPIKIFEIDAREDVIDFFLIAESPSRKRGQIYAVNRRTGRLQGSLMFFLNGIPVKRPVIYPKSWSVVGISFPAFLSFNDHIGAIRFTSPLMFNNISYSQTTQADDEERFGFRQWFSVRSQLGEPLDWGYWAGKELVGGQVIEIPDAGFTWQEVLFLSSIVREEIDASTLYNVFTGTQRAIVNQDIALTVGSYQYNFYNDLRWSSNTVAPV